MQTAVRTHQLKCLASQLKSCPRLGLAVRFCRVVLVLLWRTAGHIPPYSAAYDHYQNGNQIKIKACLPRNHVMLPKPHSSVPEAYLDGD
jgi:hypothetical protein